MTNLQERLAALSPGKRALFERLLRERGDLPPLREGPVSLVQERLWFLSRLAPESPAYNESMLFLLDGLVDVGVLESALRFVVGRHDSLRSAIVLGEDGPRLRVDDSVPALPVIPIAAEALAGAARREAATPFDLAQAPLVRATLFHLADARWALCVTAHHAVCDGWSLGLFAGEVLACYNAYRGGGVPALAPLPNQYADHAHRERELVRGGAFAASVDYFVNRLQGAPAVLDLPADRARPAAHRALGARQPFSLGRDTAAALNRLARGENATMFMATLTAFKALLARYTGTDDLVVGTVTANRRSPDVEQLIGCFVNPLALRTDLSGNPTFRQALRRVRETCLGAFSHQDAPFEQVVARLGSMRRSGYAPLLQVVFNFENAPMPALDLAGLTVRAHENYQGTSKVDLSVSLRERDGGLDGFFEYDTDLFDGDRMARMAAHLESVLQAATRDPETRLADLRVLTAVESAAARRWGSGPRSALRAGFLARFDRQVATRADAPAVVTPTEAVTYADLATRAARLAELLRGHGVGRGSRVVVAFPRSAELIAAMLAVLRTGAAFVPVDVGHPPHRIALILDDVRPDAVLADRDGRVEWAGAPVIATPTLDLSEVPARAREDVRGDDLAYVIYTSGTTGRPKGVMVTHRGLTNYLAWASASYDVPPGSESAFHTSAAFDLSVTSVFVPLAAGGTVRVFSETDGVGAVASWLSSRRAFGVLKATPAHVRMLQDLLDPAVLPTLRGTLVVGGEVLHADGLQAFRVGAEGVRIVNEYGPTETVVGCVVHEITAADAWAGPMPIGRPVANTDLHVLDRWLGPVSVGVPGELYIGGPGVARGYLGQPALTASRFVATAAGARLYRTGDLVRYRADGTLNYQGRTDTQVKLHGVRIELEEIESVLLGHPAVGAAAVTLRSGEAGQPYLAAYLAPADGADFDPSVEAELREFAARRLPGHMVPSAIVPIAALPLAPSGKLDRNALPEPGRVARPPYTPPEGATETRLADLWAGLLRRDRVGRDDDFFGLGGQSILATQLVARVRSAFGTELPLPAVFEAPTLAAMARRIDASTRGSAGIEAPITPSPRNGYLPLSFAQERLWFLEQLDPGSPAYNVPAALDLRGRLDVAALRDSLNEVVARHEALRTSFREAVDGEPVQLVAATLLLDLPVVEVRGGEAELERLVTQEVRGPFDLSAGPLVRALLLRVGHDHHVLVVTLHHIVSDGWSEVIMTNEVTQAYSARVARRVPVPAPPPVQFPDVAVWQRRALREGLFDQELAYWRERLVGAPPALELPTDADGTGGGARIPLAIPATVWQPAVAVGARLDATPFVVLLSAWQAVLSRWSGQDEVVVGTPVAARDRIELERVVGPLLNTLPLRTDLRGRPGFTDLLARARETVLGALAHQTVPFDRIVEAVAPERDLRRTAIFQALLAFQNTPGPAWDLPGLTVRQRQVQTGAAKFALTMTVAERDGGLRGTLEYDTGLFQPDTARRMLAHLGRMLHAVAVRPDLPVADLDILEPAERDFALSAWNGVPAPSGQPLVHESFERCARRWPDRLALVDDSSRLTYAQLNERASRLAARLAGLGVGPEVRVAIDLGRSADTVMAMLAVLRAGGCFIPLDSSHPVERREAALRDIDAAVLIADGASGIGGGEVPTVRLDRMDTEQATWPSTAPPPPALPRNLAYIIFTSGSTGRPKSVGVEHSALAAYVAGIIERLELPAEGTYALVTTLAADLGYTSVFPALCQGATLFVPSAEQVADADALVASFRSHPVDCLKLVPSHLAALLALAGPDVLPRKRLIVTGEACGAELVERLLEQVPDGCRITNSYGPTETTVGVLTHEMERATSPVPLGVPLPGTQVYVLDAALRPAPINVTGEVYIGGVTVARGYLGRPDLTAERFVADPFGRRPGGRLYRTGDRARRRSDGLIEFRGRLDDQVKIRGHRIEPGEVEAALLALPGVREAAVIAREAEDGPFLAAFVGPEIEPDKLRAGLRRKLPEPMIPAVLVPMEALPRTTNGKVDRSALRAIEASPAGGRAPRLAPRTPTERTLAAIWSEVLGARDIGALDDFFDLGGHSLLATQVLSRVRRAFDTDLSVRAIFEAPTLAELAERVDRAHAEGVTDQAPPLEPAARGGPLVLSFAQERLWFLDRFEPGSNAYNIPGGVRLRGRVDVAAVERSIQDLVARHEPLRTRFPSVDGRPVQVVDEQVEITLERLDLREVPQDEREARAHDLVEQRARQSFDLASGPLLGATLVELDTHASVLLLTIHHIVADGWAMGVFIREFARLYAGHVSGRPVALPPLPLQYADVAAWQRRWLTDTVLDQDLAYWRQNLAGAPDVIDLPTDFARPAVKSSRGDRAAFVLPEADWRPLAAIGARHGATPFMVMLAVWTAVLARWTGQHDLVIGAPVAGRDRPEFEELIGLFVNTLPIRTDMTDDPSFTELLARVSETTLGAFAHQHVPFDKVVDAVAPRRDPSRTPLVQVIFHLNNAPPPPLELHDIVLEPMELQSGTAKLDLSLSVTERQGALQGYLGYNTDLFTPATIERLGRQVRALARSIVADPDARISQLSMLDKDERARVLQGWKRRSAAPTLVDLLAGQAMRTPDHAAVAFEGEELTYAELHRRANGLAGRLRAAGVGPERRVGVCLERSPRMVEAVLAIVKAGGAFVPLDPQLPPVRLQAMIEDAGLTLVLADAATAARLPETEVAVHRLGTPLAADQAPEVDLDASNAAYLVYTSGTSGTSKGVVVAHRAIVHHLATRQELYPITAADRFLHKASLGFDIGIWEILGALVTGATIVMARPGGQHDSGYLVRLMAEQRVTVAHFGPAPLRVVLDERALGACQDLRLVFVGGEPLTHDLRERFFASLGEVTLVHQYGPTETTVDVVYFACPPGPMARALPIGRPARGTTAYVLDNRLTPVAVGLPGELYVGGACLSRGYHARPDLTAQRFVADPFGEPGGRLYRTGDLVRWLADGALEFIGRSDRQIKLRGFRIELPEIEVALRAHARVQDAAAVVQDEGNERKRITAFAVADGDADPAELRAFLSARLPEFMVPAELHVLERIPLTSTGKVDHRALERWRPPVPAVEDTQAEPSDEVERAVSAIFREVLEATQIGVDDSFFALGGNSLIAIRAVERIGEEFGLCLSVPDFFEAPTVRDVAAIVCRTRGTTSGRPSALVRLHRPGGPRLPLYCVHALLGGVSEYAELARLLTDTESVDGVRSPALDDGGPANDSLERIAAAYVAAIRDAQPNGPYRLLGWSFGGVIAYEMARILREDHEEVRQVVLVDAWAPHRMAASFQDGAPRLLGAFAANLIPGLGEQMTQGSGFWELPVDRQVEELVQWARQAGRLSPGTTVETVRRHYDIFDAHVRALRSYRPKPITGELTVVRARDGRGGFRERFPQDRETLGWGSVMAGDGAVAAVELPGEHHTILRMPHVIGLAAFCSRDDDRGVTR